MQKANTATFKKVINILELVGQKSGFKLGFFDMQTPIYFQYGVISLQGQNINDFENKINTLVPKK